MEDAPDGPRDLLLYSLGEFREIILGALAVSGARRVVEVGSEAAHFTRVLADWAVAQEGRVTCIEPTPSEGLLDLAHAVDRLTIVRGRSPAALLSIERQDAYFLDGDHNYCTVLGELQAIDEMTEEGRQPFLLCMQDVGWPWGRRDLYYAPDLLPAEAVHPHSFDVGVTPGAPIAGRGGFRSEGQYAIALQEGGQGNGVLTALEDHLARRGGAPLGRVLVPSVFGLAILFPQAAPWADQLRAQLNWVDGNPMLERLERNRLDLYLRVLELQRALTHREVAARLAYERLIAARDMQLDVLEARLLELERGQSVHL